MRKQKSASNEHDFFMFRYKVKPCKRGLSCPNKVNCNFYHDEIEMRRDPSVHLSWPCKHAKVQLHDGTVEWHPARCPMGLSCTHAHSRMERQYHPFIYKTNLCTYSSTGNCFLGKYCAHAHGKHDLRRPSPEFNGPNLPTNRVPVPYPQHQPQPQQQQQTQQVQLPPQRERAANQNKIKSNSKGQAWLAKENAHLSSPPSRKSIISSPRASPPRSQSSNSTTPSNEPASIITSILQHHAQYFPNRDLDKTTLHREFKRMNNDIHWSQAFQKTHGAIRSFMQTQPQFEIFNVRQKSGSNSKNFCVRLARGHSGNSGQRRRSVSPPNSTLESSSQSTVHSRPHSHPRSVSQSARVPYDHYPADSESESESSSQATIECKQQSDRARPEEQKEVEHRCEICGTPTTSCCGKCKAVYYCSAECQRADWKTHRALCGKIIKPEPIDNPFSAGDKILIRDKSASGQEGANDATAKLATVLYANRGERNIRVHFDGEASTFDETLDTVLEGHRISDAPAWVNGLAKAVAAQGYYLRDIHRSQSAQVRFLAVFVCFAEEIYERSEVALVRNEFIKYVNLRRGEFGSVQRMDSLSLSELIRALSELYNVNCSVFEYDEESAQLNVLVSVESGSDLVPSVRIAKWRNRFAVMRSVQSAFVAPYRNAKYRAGVCKRKGVAVVSVRELRLKQMSAHFLVELGRENGEWKKKYYALQKTSAEAMKKCAEEKKSLKAQVEGCTQSIIEQIGENQKLKDRLKLMDGSAEPAKWNQLSLEHINEIEAELDKATLKVKRTRQRMLERKFNCVACLEAPKNMLIMGCRHVVLCQACEGKMQTKVCPLCQKPYKKVMKVHI